MAKERKNSSLTNAAVLKATGSSWQDWVEFLDSFKAHRFHHHEIVTLLESKITDKSLSQKIAIAYSQNSMGSIPRESFFSINVSKTIGLPVVQVWDKIMSPAGIEIWLGKNSIPNSTSLEKFTTTTGITGSLKDYQKFKNLRMTWKSAKWKTFSKLTITLTPREQKTILSIFQDGIPNATEREHMHLHWKKITAALAKLARE